MNVRKKAVLIRNAASQISSQSIDPGGKTLHRAEEPGDLLDVMDEVIGLERDLREDILDVRVGLAKPTVIYVQLIAEYEAEGVHRWWSLFVHRGGGAYHRVAVITTRRLPGTSGL